MKLRDLRCRQTHSCVTTMPVSKESDPTTHVEPPQATNLRGSAIPNSAMRQESSRTLCVNLFVCNITVWIMFVVAGVVMAFALLAMDELRYEYN